MDMLLPGTAQVIFITEHTGQCANKLMHNDRPRSSADLEVDALLALHQADKIAGDDAALQQGSWVPCQGFFCSDEA